jgi:hypothetical protein
MRQNFSKRIPVRTAAFVLFFAVAGLSTLARHSQYLPQSDPLCHFSKITKMEVVEQPAHFNKAPFHPIARVVLHEPQFSAVPLEESEQLTLRLIGCTVSFQDRAPPSFLA